MSEPKDDDLPPQVIQQRFVFNLSRSSEHFYESEASVNSLMATGEIEFF